MILTERQQAKLLLKLRDCVSEGVIQTEKSKKLFEEIATFGMEYAYDREEMQLQIISKKDKDES